MKKRMKTLLTVLILTALCLLTFTLPINAATLHVATNGSNTLPYDTYAKAKTTIQAAVTAATAGDVINVASSGGFHGTGSYTENVVVNKQLIIQSENGYATTTVIAASPTVDVFYVSSNGVTIDGFTVYGASSGTSAGIYLNDVEDCLIQNNRCSVDQSDRNVNGIYLDASNRNAILDNICNYNSYDGIYLVNSNRNTIANNEFNHNGQNGIHSYNAQSNVNTISSNNISNNSSFNGIYLNNSINNFVLKNFLIGNSRDIYLVNGSSGNRIYLNSFNSGTNVTGSGTTNFWRPGKNNSPFLNLCYFYSSTCHSNYLGNYWSALSGTGSDPDGDGIFNTTYAADGGTDLKPLASSTISNYHIQAWYLNNDGNMYEDATDKAPKSKLVSFAKGTEIWIADEAAQVDLNFPSGQWYGQICIVNNTGGAPDFGHTFKVEIGSSTNGTDFTAGPYATITADAANIAFEYQTNSAAVPVSKDNYLALRITNDLANAKDYYIWTGGAWSYTSSQGDGDPNYSLPVELSVFTAQVINNTPTIYWSTQSETDNLGWYIYRNTKADFATASRISGLIPGHGTTSQPQDYIYEDIDELVVDQTYNYWLESIDLGGTINHFDRMVSITIPEHNDPHQHITPPQIYDLRAEPNPFTESTNFNFMLQKTAIVEVSVYNIKGELVKSYPAQHVTADETISLSWDGKSDNGKTLPVGIYLYRLQVNGRTEQTKRIILMR